MEATPHWIKEEQTPAPFQQGDTGNVYSATNERDTGNLCSASNGQGKPKDVGNKKSHILIAEEQSIQPQRCDTDSNGSTHKSSGSKDIEKTFKSKKKDKKTNGNKWKQMETILHYTTKEKEKKTKKQSKVDFLIQCRNHKHQGETWDDENTIMSDETSHHMK